jgi:hypothetical protein
MQKVANVPLSFPFLFFPASRSLERSDGVNGNAPTVAKRESAGCSPEIEERDDGGPIEPAEFARSARPNRTPEDNAEV